MSKLSDADLSWDKLDKGKFLSFSATMLFGVRVLIYPSNLVKTRLQAQSLGMDKRQYTGRCPLTTRYH